MLSMNWKLKFEKQYHLLYHQKTEYLGNKIYVLIKYMYNLYA